MKHLTKQPADALHKIIFRGVEQARNTESSERIAAHRETLSAADRERMRLEQNALASQVTGTPVDNIVKPGETLGAVVGRITDGPLKWSQEVRYEIGGETWPTTLAKANLIQPGQIVTIEGDVIVIREKGADVPAGEAFVAETLSENGNDVLDEDEEGFEVFGPAAPDGGATLGVTAGKRRKPAGEEDFETFEPAVA